MLIEDGYYVFFFFEYGNFIVITFSSSESLSLLHLKIFSILLSSWGRTEIIFNVPLLVLMGWEVEDIVVCLAIKIICSSL